MARRKVKELALTSWDDVDAALKEVLELEGKLENIERQLTLDTVALKKQAEEDAKPDQARITALGKDIKAFVTEHKSELDGKTKTMPHGQTGFRQVTKVTIPQGKADEIIANLKRMRLNQCVNTVVTSTIDREALRSLPQQKIEAAGAVYKKNDEFWFEAAKEKL